MLLISVPCPLLKAMSCVVMCALHPRRKLSEPRGKLLHLLNHHCKRPGHRTIDTLIKSLKFLPRLVGKSV